MLGKQFGLIPVSSDSIPECKADGFKVKVLVFCLGFFLMSVPAFSDVLSLGYAVESKDIRVEINAGEIETDSQYEESLAGLTEVLKVDQLRNPEAPIELAWINGPDSPRGPSSAEQNSRPARFINKLKERLLGAGVAPAREGGVDFNPKKHLKPEILGKLNEAYLDHSKITWTVVRVLTNTGVRVATLMYAGLNLYQALTVGLGVFTACTAVAWNSKHLLHFEENFRLYSVFSKKQFPKLRALLDQPAVEKRIYKPHYYLNWGLLETLFGVIVLFGENAVRSLWGLNLEVPGLWPFLLSATVSTASQGVADLAVAKYEHLAKKEGLPGRLLNSNLYKRLAFNSVVSVAGFTMINTAALPVQVTGWVFLGALSAYGFAYSKYLDRKAVRAADPCLDSLSAASAEASPK
ncbi:MAG: hypothetical protein KGP28_05670 [Bdellovibrionales bacterium]|nr:hypothetical protein [Bdellovibrionales bacterium]